MKVWPSLTRETWETTNKRNSSWEQNRGLTDEITKRCPLFSGSESLEILSRRIACCFRPVTMPCALLFPFGAMFIVMILLLLHYWIPSMLRGAKMTDNESNHMWWKVVILLYSVPSSCHNAANTIVNRSSKRTYCPNIWSLTLVPDTLLLWFSYWWEHLTHSSWIPWNSLGDGSIFCSNHVVLGGVLDKIRWSWLPRKPIIWLEGWNFQSNSQPLERGGRLEVGLSSNGQSLWCRPIYVAYIVRPHRTQRVSVQGVSWLPTPEGNCMVTCCNIQDKRGLSMHILDLTPNLQIPPRAFWCGEDFWVLRPCSWGEWRPGTPSGCLETLASWHWEAQSMACWDGPVSASAIPHSFNYQA